jgi:hypothetical protein
MSSIIDLDTNNDTRSWRDPQGVERSKRVDFYQGPIDLPRLEILERGTGLSQPAIESAPPSNRESGINVKIGDETRVWRRSNPNRNLDKERH